VPLKHHYKEADNSKDASKSRDTSEDRYNSCDPKDLKGSNYIVHRQTAESEGQQQWQAEHHWACSNISRDVSNDRDVCSKETLATAESQVTLPIRRPKMLSFFDTLKVQTSSQIITTGVR
jgi:hypothetical protein